MTKFTDALGAKYQANRKNLLTRSFELGGHTFKVRIPLVAESDAIYKKVSEPDADTVEKIYVEITASLRQFEATQTEDFKFTDNDKMRFAFWANFGKKKRKYRETIQGKSFG
jgi:hypothetical protein